MKTIFKNKSIIIFAMVCVGSLLLSACKKSDPTPIVYADSYLRVVNAVSGSTDQDFYQDNKKISTTAIAYGSASSDYYTVKGGPSVISFTNTGTTTVNASSNVSAEEGAYYTVFYYANATATPTIYGFKDDRTAPAAGKAKVRFLNIGFSFNNSLNVTYTSTGALIASDLGLTMSAYSSIDPNTDLGVTVIGSPVTGVIPGSNFVAGKIYTVWFNALTPTTAQYHVVQQN